MMGKCRKCGAFEDLRGGLCENHQLERDRAHSLEFEERKKMSKEDILKELEERKKKARNWWG